MTSKCAYGRVDLPESAIVGGVASGERFEQTSDSLRWKVSTSAGLNFAVTSTVPPAAMVPEDGVTEKGASAAERGSADPSMHVTFHL